MPATQEQPPPYSATPQVNTMDFTRRQEELEKKAAELERKEQEMKNMQYGGEFDSPYKQSQRCKLQHSKSAAHKAKPRSTKTVWTTAVQTFCPDWAHCNFYN